MNNSNDSTQHPPEHQSNDSTQHTPAENSNDSTQHTSEHGTRHTAHGTRSRACCRLPRPGTYPRDRDRDRDRERDRDPDRPLPRLFSLASARSSLAFPLLSSSSFCLCSSAAISSGVGSMTSPDLQNAMARARLQQRHIHPHQTDKRTYAASAMNACVGETRGPYSSSCVYNSPRVLPHFLLEVVATVNAILHLHSHASGPPSQLPGTQRARRGLAMNTNTRQEVI